jgi:hypothetical protein
MLPGIYSVEFQSNLGAFGLGIAVFDNGKINGGDLSHLYKGSYSLDEKAIRVEVFVSQYRDIQESVFGSLNNFTLNLTGDASDDGFNTTGSVTGQPQLNITVIGKRISELAA